MLNIQWSLFTKQLLPRQSQLMLKRFFAHKIQVRHGNLASLTTTKIKYIYNHIVVFILIINIGKKSMTPTLGVIAMIQCFIHLKIGNFDWDQIYLEY